MGGLLFHIGNHQKFGKPAEWIRQLGKRIVKLDVEDWGVEKAFCKIGEGDVDWSAVRAARAGIRYTGWATAEVAGGGRDRCAEILANMRKHLLGARGGARPAGRSHGLRQMFALPRWLGGW